MEISDFPKNFLEIQCDFCNSPAVIRWIDPDQGVDDQPVCHECAIDFSHGGLDPWISNGWIGIPENERRQARLI